MSHHTHVPENNLKPNPPWPSWFPASMPSREMKCPWQEPLQTAWPVVWPFSLQQEPLAGLWPIRVWMLNFFLALALFPKSEALLTFPRPFSFLHLHRLSIFLFQIGHLGNLFFWVFLLLLIAAAQQLRSLRTALTKAITRSFLRTFWFFPLPHEKGNIPRAPISFVMWFIRRPLGLLWAATGGVCLY